MVPERVRKGDNGREARWGVCGDDRGYAVGGVGWRAAPGARRISKDVEVNERTYAASACGRAGSREHGDVLRAH